MVDRMDQGIANIVAELKKNGQFENTIIFFMQDNGGCAEQQAPRRQQEPPQHRATGEADASGHEARRIRSRWKRADATRDGFPIRMGNKVFPGPEDTYVAYGRGWANVSNTPFREYKHWVHEGGISTPLIVHWPKGISAKGEFRDQPAHLIDITATAYDLAGREVPEGRDAPGRQEPRSGIHEQADRPRRDLLGARGEPGRSGGQLETRCEVQPTVGTV